MTSSWVKTSHLCISTLKTLKEATRNVGFKHDSGFQYENELKYTEENSWHFARIQLFNGRDSKEWSLARGFRLN